MSVYKYQSFNEAKRAEIIGDQDLTEELADAYIAAVREPDLWELLEHQREQCRRAKESGADSPYWSILESCTDQAEDALKSGSTARIVSAFMSISNTASEILKEPESDINKYRDAYIEKLKSEMPLKIFNGKIRFLKGCAEIIARGIWEKDIERKIRISEACEMVWQELVEVATQYNVKEALPDKASSLKPWLKPSAPEHAQKGGRPAKK